MVWFMEWNCGRVAMFIQLIVFFAEHLLCLSQHSRKMIKQQTNELSTPLSNGDK